MTAVDITARVGRARVPRPWLVAERLVRREGAVTRAAKARASSANGSARKFIRHFIEMLVAMMAGMMFLGMAVRIGTIALAGSGVYDDAGLRAVIMTANMTIGMVIWMRHRGHNLSQIAEMAGAMFVPVAVLIFPFWAGLLSRGALMGGLHVLMLPAMLGVMLRRRDVYSRHHG